MSGRAARPSATSSLRMVTADGFRAGLVFGEPGVGKTSLVRAGLIPHLRDHGIVALDLRGSPVSRRRASRPGCRRSASSRTPASCRSRSSRARSPTAVAGQQFVFVVDDVGIACSDDRSVGELAELFAKVVSRSAGRARFLFVCASERQHLLGNLERRTGSLFPPSNRYELLRMPVPAAAALFDRVLSLSGVAADPALAEAVVQWHRERGHGAARRGSPDLRDGDARPPDHVDPGAPEGRRAERARGAVAPRRVRRDRQRALRAAAVRRARGRRTDPEAAAPRSRAGSASSRASRSTRSTCSSSGA